MNEEEKNQLASGDINMIESNRLCCCIPDQSKLDEGCQELAEYTIWAGDTYTVDDYTESCAEHVGLMLDDNDRFEIVRL